MKKYTGSPVATLLLAIVSDPLGFLHRAFDRLAKRMTLAHQRLKASPQRGSTLEILIWIGSLALIAIAVIAIVRARANGWVEKIPD